MPPEDEITTATRKLLDLLPSDTWRFLNEALDRIVLGDSGVSSRPAAPLNLTTNPFPPLRDDSRERWTTDRVRDITRGLKIIEADFRMKAPELVAQLPQAAEAAEQIPVDSPVARAVERIAESVRQLDVSKLGMIGVLFLVFWLVSCLMKLGRSLPGPRSST